MAVAAVGAEVGRARCIVVGPLGDGRCQGRTHAVKVRLLVAGGARCGGCVTTAQVGAQCGGQRHGASPAQPAAQALGKGRCGVWGRRLGQAGQEAGELRTGHARGGRPVLHESLSKCLGCLGWHWKTGGEVYYAAPAGSAPRPSAVRTRVSARRSPASRGVRAAATAHAGRGPAASPHTRAASGGPGRRPGGGATLAPPVRAAPPRAT